MFKQIGNFLLLKTTQSNPLREMSRNKRNAIAKKVTKKRRILNPGIQLQSQLLNKGHDNQADYFDADELESDFMNLEYTHKEHHEQMNKMKEKEKVLIVKQKYFKQKFPNFLTWNDKQQIQYLYKTNSEEWTFERLSEGFPALPEIIKKVAKADWTKRTSEKIISHDNAVKRNWDIFKSGQMDLPQKLTNHLNKFTSRNHMYYDNKNALNNNEILKTNVPKVNGEFSEIIKSYERIKNKTKPVEDEDIEPQQLTKIKKVQKEMYLSANKIDQRNLMTLEKLKHNLEAEVSLGKDIDEDDKILLKELTDMQIIKNAPPETSLIDLKDISRTGYLTGSNLSTRDDSHLKYPEKITIPKNKFKPGCTYKLYDCYYDSDGTFLYRVPGMEK